MSGSARLLHLLELANQGPAMRAALAEEVAELLTAWPDDCPGEMRSPCEALLARAVREVDDDTKARLRVRLYADPSLASRVLPREAHDRDLIHLARDGADIRVQLADTLRLDDARADYILSDRTGHALAVACKAMGLGRAAYSTLAMLTARTDDVASCYARLEIYDSVPAAEAARELRNWRSAPPRVAA